MRAPTVVLVALAALYCLGVEAVTRYVLSPASRIQRVFTDELSRTVELRRAGDGRPRSLLIVGNSLLDAAVDFNQLNSALGPQWQATRLFLSDSDYLDWRFGLRRLLGSGAHPDAVAVMLTPRQLVSDHFRGSYFAHYMMRLSDLPRVAEEAHLHRTEASSLVFAHYSLFYGMRGALRNGILSKLFPALPDVLFRFGYTHRARLDDDDLRRLSANRLRELKATTDGYGVALTLLLPPLPAAPDQEPEGPVIESGRRTGVHVLNPVPAGDLPLTAFRDGFHANLQGLTVYTTRLAPVLRQWLDASASGSTLQAEDGRVRREKPTDENRGATDGARPTL